MDRFVMSKHVRDNWQHFEHMVSKYMAHMHYPAAGSMVDYVVRDTDNHIQTLLIGSVLDVEGFKSWQKADTLVKEFNSRLRLGEHRAQG